MILKNRTKKIIVILIFLILSGFLLVHLYGNRKTEKDKKIHVAILCYDESDTFISELVSCYNELFQKDNKEGTVTVYDAANSQRTQDDQVDELVEEKYDVWCVNLVDRTNASRLIDAAKEHHIPVIFFNREPVKEDMKRWNQLYYVGADAKESGNLQGQLITDYIKDNPQMDRNGDGKIQYVILEGELGHQDSIIRTESVINCLKLNGIQTQKLGSGIANWNRAQAQNRMMQLIAQNKNTIELVIANNDDMALGAMDVYQKLDYTKSDTPVIFGIDGTKDGLEAVKNKELAGTVYNDKENQAKAMEQLTLALATKKGLDKIKFTSNNTIYLNYYSIDSGNVDLYLDSTKTGNE